MSYLTKADIDFIVFDQNQFLSDLAQIYRYSQTNTALGQVVTETYIGEVYCRIAEIGDRRSEGVYQEDLHHGIKSESFTHFATFPHGTNITLKDKIVVGVRSFEVIGLVTLGTNETAQRIMINEIKW